MVVSLEYFYGRQMKHAEKEELLREMESLRKDRILKDDTIQFLQKEKESLIREVSNIASFSWKPRLPVLKFTCYYPGLWSAHTDRR